MKRLTRVLLLFIATATATAAAILALPAEPASAVICGNGHVLFVGLPLSSCTGDCNGVEISDVDLEPHAFVYACLIP